MTETHYGSCLCRAVSFTVSGPLRGVVACHCIQCRKQSGHFVAATQVPREAIELGGEEYLKWYRSSPQARRGFCADCGSALFWQREGSDQVSILAGSFDSPTGLKLERHIFCASKGDYYEITDGLTQAAEW